MARKSGGKTGRHSNVRSIKATRSKGEVKKSSQSAPSRSSSSHRGSEKEKVVSISRGRKESSASAQSSSGVSGSIQARALTDHDEIRQWAEDRGAHPACVRGTGDREDVGMIRLDFPGYSGERSLEEIGWDEWFDKFDDNGLALLVQEQTAGGQKSNFNKLVRRETTKARRESSKSGSRGRGAA